jgi:hypothetical protein
MGLEMARKYYMTQTKRAWNGGPPRQWSGKNPGHWIPSADGGYSGSYVCDECGRAVDGIYKQTFANVGSDASQRWLCGPCRTVLRPKREQPAHLRRDRCQANQES